MKDQLEEILRMLYEIPDLIVSNPIDVAFSIGVITAQLEIIKKSLTYGNGEF